MLLFHIKKAFLMKAKNNFAAYWQWILDVLSFTKYSLSRVVEGRGPMKPGSLIYSRCQFPRISERWGKIDNIPLLRKSFFMCSDTVTRSVFDRQIGNWCWANAYRAFLTLRGENTVAGKIGNELPINAVNSKSMSAAVIIYRKGCLLYTSDAADEL